MDVDESDEGLLARLAMDDDDALALLFRAHVTAIHAYARSMLRSREDAQEVVQQTFFTLWEKRMTLNTYVGSPRPWLIVTAHNHARNLLRTRGRAERRQAPLETLDLHATHEGPDIAAEQAETRRHLEAALASLPPLEREIVDLCITEGMPYKQAAAALGIAHGSVRNRLSRARRSLRAFLTPEGGVSDG